MGGSSSLLGPPRAWSTHEDDRTTRPHCWCLQEEGRLIFKGILSLSRTFCRRRRSTPSISFGKGQFVFYASSVPTDFASAREIKIFTIDNNLVLIANDISEVCSGTRPSVLKFLCFSSVLTVL